MRRTRLRTNAHLVAAALAMMVVSMACLADTTVTLNAQPIEATRGGLLTYEARLGNDAATALEHATLYLPLPNGLDQWTAVYRVDGGPWLAYPPNGLVPLDPIPAFGASAIDVQVLVEQGAPASVSTTAQILDISGPLAAAPLTVNVLPSVDAGADLITDLGGSIALASATAGDGGGGIASYAWDDGGAGGSFDDPATLRPVYTPPAISGLIELTLRVTDHDAGEAADSLRLRVNSVPTVDLGVDLTASEGDALALGAATGDADGWIVSYAWNDGGAGGTFSPSSGSSNPTYLVPNLAGCAGGDLVLSVTVTDDWGAEATDTIVLHVENVNAPPIADAGPDRDVLAGDAITVVGAATDPDGSIVSTVWIQIEGPPVTLDDASSLAAAFVAPEVDEARTVVLRLTATDECGDSTSDEVTIRVAPPEPGDDDGTGGGDDGDDGSGGDGDADDDPDDADPVETPLGSLDVSIEPFDRNGPGRSPFDPPASGETVTFRVTATNLGAEGLRGVRGRLPDGTEFALYPDRLDPWSTATGEGPVRSDVDPADGQLEIRIEVFGTDAEGRTVVGEDTFVFFVGANGVALLELDVAPDRAEVAAGETVSYAYRLTNAGDIVIEHLQLIDDCLGLVVLAGTRLEPGETSTAFASTTLADDEPAGPRASRARLTGFTPDGEAVIAEAEATINVTGLAGGGGARGDARDRVVISEVAWAGSRDDPTAEWIELANPGTAVVDLSGWHLSWYRLGPDGQAPDEAKWRTVALQGHLEPIERAEEAAAPVAVFPAGDGLWRVAGSTDLGSESSTGYYLLERGHDGAVDTVAADLIYGAGFSEPLELPDRGAAMVLIAPDGRVVDAVCTIGSAGDRWPGGDARSGASMERIDLAQGAHAANWQTNAGVIASGRSVGGRRLLGTPGRPNACPLDELIRAASEAVVPRPIPDAGSIVVAGVDPAAAASIRWTTTASSPAGGGGATVPAFTTSRGDGSIELRFDPTAVPEGKHFVWITWRDGEALLLPLVR